MVEKITASELRARKDEFVIIDVREADEIASGKIEGSTNMPLGLAIRKAKHGEIDDLKDKKICTYCASGLRGGIAAELLNNSGFKAVNLDGGFPSWKKK